MKTYLLLIAVFVSTLVHAQSIQDRLNRINADTKSYDPYYRVFTYNENTGKLKWVTNDGSITCEAKLSDIKVYKEPSGSSFYVSFKTKDNSKSIYCSYGSANVDITSISMNNGAAADRIVAEIEGIARSIGGGGGGGSEVNTQALLARINQICSEYDDAKRIFSLNQYSGELTWITKKGDITCKANINKVNITMKPSSNYFSITFTCIDGSECIDCNYYSKPVSTTSVSIERSESMAIEVVEKLNRLKSSKTTKNVGGNNNGRYVPQPQQN